MENIDIHSGKTIEKYIEEKRKKSIGHHFDADFIESYEREKELLHRQRPRTKDVCDRCLNVVDAIVPWRNSRIGLLWMCLKCRNEIENERKSAGGAGGSAKQATAG